EIGLVDGSHLDQRGKCVEHLVNFAGTIVIAGGVAIHKDGLWAELGGGAQRHGGMHAKLARFVRGGGDDAALVTLSTHHNGFAFQRWIEQFLDGNEEGIHVDVEDSFV